jgi:hypothetical protein
MVMEGWGRKKEREREREGGREERGRVREGREGNPKPRLYSDTSPNTDG